MPRSRTLKLAAIAAAAGVFSGLFGVGGGTVMVPLFILWLGYEEREATGTSLAAIVIIATAAVLVQLAYGNVHVRDGLLVGIPAVGGVVAGTWLQQRVPRRKLQILFALLLLGSAVKLVIGVILGAIAIGFVAGMIAGVFGVGGGVVFVPGLVILLGLSQVDAEATSLLAIVPVALVGAYRQSGYGNLRLREGIVVGALAVPFAGLGVVIVNAVPERAIELGFAALIVYVAIGLLRSDVHE